MKCKSCGKDTTRNPKTNKYNAYCKSCFTKNNSTTGRKKTESLIKANDVIKKNKNFIYKTPKPKVQQPAINVGEIYHILKQLIEVRYLLQQKYDELWITVKQGYNRSSEFKDLSDRIGDINHQINKLINVLIRYKGQYNSYKLAIDYLYKERERVARIIDSWEDKIRSVEYGNSHWINSNGSRDYDSTKPMVYLQKQRKKYERITNLIDRVENLNRQ